MTIQQIRHALAEIAANGDPDSQHHDLDKLYVAVLESIASGTADDAAASAREALEGERLAFPRWYA